MNETFFYRSYIRQALTSRTERNPRYSIRAFSRALEIDVATVSRILSGKQVPSVKVAKRIFKALGPAPDEQALFLASLAEAHRARGLQRLSAWIKAAPESHSFSSKELSLDLWRVVADWYHAAILELTYVEGFKSDPKWIASELGITETEARIAIQRLIEVGLLESRGGKLRKTNEQLTTADKALTTSAHRKLQRQVLEGAIDSLENDPIESRNHTSMTMAIDPAKMGEAKEMITQFNRALCGFLESGRRKQVYQLGICLYPLQKRRTKENRK